MEVHASKPVKTIFVIMPFTETPTRNKEELTSFFEDIIQKPIESSEVFSNKYKVRRSDETFNITEKIIKDLVEADLIIADLSGKQPNPNVMYELGVRFALSDKPVILMRENYVENKGVFDITVFYTHPYNPLKYADLQKHLIEKIRRFETGEELYESPILKVVGGNVALQHSALRELTSEQQWERVLQGIGIVAEYSTIAFGSNGNRISFREISTRSGIEIANNTYDEDLLKSLGIQRISALANEIKASAGDGVKTAVIIAEAILTYINQATKAQRNQKQVIADVRKGMDYCLENLKVLSTEFIEHHHLLGTAWTAAKDHEVGNRVVEAFEKVKDKDVIFVVEHSSPISQLEIIDGHLFDFGYSSPSFATDLETESCTLENCYVVVCLHKISSMRDIIPLLEYPAKSQASILLVAEDVEGEALATMQVNNERGTIKCCAIKIPSLRTSNGSPRFEMLKDLAALTKSTLIGIDMGHTLKSIQENDYGYAEKIMINNNTTQIFGGAGLITDIELRIKSVRQQLNAGLSEDYLPYYRQRLASLLGKTAIIKIRKASNRASSEERYRTLSALSAVTTLADEGWVSGGGKTLFDLGERLNKRLNINDPEAVGMKAVVAGLQKPFVQIIKSSQKISGGQSQVLLPDDVIDSAKILRKILEIVRDHTCAILETERWDVMPKTKSGWGSEEF